MVNGRSRHRSGKVHLLPNAGFLNEHGYCWYCGGFTPKVFREHMDEVALHTEIDKLAIHLREKMREIVR